VATLVGTMTSTTGRILVELKRALTAPEALDALQALTALRTELDTYEREQVRRALEQGESFAAVARELGISRQAAHRRYRGLVTNGPTYTPRVLRLLQLARQEAARAGAEHVEVEHVALVLAGRARPATTGAPAPTRIGPRLRAVLSSLETPIEVEALRGAIAGSAVA